MRSTSPLLNRRNLWVVGCGVLAAAVAFGVAYRPAPTTPDVSPSEKVPIPEQSGPDEATGPIVFHDVLNETGIKFRHTDGSSGRRYIVEQMTGGVALFDYNGDGLIDIYFLNGRPLPGAAAQGPPPRNALYRNEGGWKFTDVTDEAGVGGAGFGMGVAVGDYDNDGWPDLYVNNFGLNVLYHNNGNGTFTDVTKKAGVACTDRVGAGTNFLDIDGDGNLDLFVSNYVIFSFDKNPNVTVMGYAAYAGPYLFEKQPNVLFRNNGDGTFTDISVQSGIAAVTGPGMGTVCADYDNDGDTDIIVANDMSMNFLFENDGKGKFEEVALLRGMACDGNGQVHSNMGVTCADYDNDGWLDFFFTSFASEMPALYRNMNGKNFVDVTLSAGALKDAYPHVNWGTGFIDFDNDGHRDLYVVNGHLDENVHEYDQAAVYAARDFVFKNMGNGKFVNVSDQAGDGMKLELSGRGAAFADLDNDGDIDVVVLNTRREPTILRNMYYERGGKNRWLRLRLHGVKTNRDGIGARVRVTAGGQSWIDEVHSGHGFQSHWGPELHFGLGKHERVDRIEVRWIGGGTDVIENIGVDQFVTIAEGRGVEKAGPKP